MSNQIVGAIYAQIINDVVEAAGVDFEEGGVDSSALAELKAGWQAKLSSLGIASFPWDPKPTDGNGQSASATPAATAAAKPNANSAANAANNYTQMTLSPPPNASPLSMPQQMANGISAAPSPVIKTEPGLAKEPALKQEPGTASQPSYNAGAAPVGAPAQHPGEAAARHRASQMLQQRYGARADASITSMYKPPQGAAAQQGADAQKAGQPQQPVQQYAQGMMAATAAALQNQQPQVNGLPSAQVDGAAEEFECTMECEDDEANEEFEGIMMKRDANGNPIEMGRVEIDRMIHAQIASRAKQLEGGGLMVSLKEATKVRSLPTKNGRRRGNGQADGNDDGIKEEDDDELINSDLDDPDDDQEDDDDDDDSNNHMMLCMYDKVQRVKNKWKCTLKDGVLLVNGREYVFHKATGEYEW